MDKSVVVRSKADNDSGMDKVATDDATTDKEAMEAKKRKLEYEEEEWVGEYLEKEKQICLQVDREWAKCLEHGPRPPLAVYYLDQQIFQIFHLPRGDTWRLNPGDIVEVDPLLMTVLGDLDKAWLESPPRRSWMSYSARQLRVQMHILLATCISEEKKRLESERVEACGLPAVAVNEKPVPRTVSWRFATGIEYSVIFEGKVRTLTTFAESTLWFDTPEQFGTNFVDAGAGPAEHYQHYPSRNRCIASMAAIHRARKEAGMENCVVYGLHYGPYAVQFFKIDNSSKIWDTDTFNMHPSEVPIVASYIRLIVRDAISRIPAKMAAHADVPPPENRYNFQVKFGERFHDSGPDYATCDKPVYNFPPHVRVK